jgi:hypothetical protein
MRLWVQHSRFCVIFSRLFNSCNQRFCGKTSLSHHKPFYMKYFLILFVLIPGWLQAQDCMLKKEKDQFTQQDRLTTGFIQLTNARLSMTADNKELDFFLSVGGDKCFDEASTLSIVFEDGRTKLNVRNTGSMNCEGLFHFTLRNTPTPPSNLQRLAAKKIKSMVLTNDKAVTSILLNESQQQLVQTAADCMAKEAKTLIAKP